MLIMTEDGERIIHDDLILCIDRPRTIGDHLIITLVYHLQTLNTLDGFALEKANKRAFNLV
jgi:hypothetical protein